MPFMPQKKENSIRIFPILDWLLNYNKKWLKGDLIAGLTVGVMLIPQGMAYAMIAGLPAVYGLYTSLIPVVVYAIFGTSRQLSVGPVAMDSLFVAATVSVFAISPGTENYIQLVLLLTFMVGALQLIFGLVRLGFLVNFLSKPVIVGFTSAAALIIALNQFKHLLGISIPRNNQVHWLIGDVFSEIGTTHWLTFILGLVSIGVILGLKKLSKKIPSALVLVIIGVVLTSLFGWDEKGVAIVGEIPSGLPKLAMPLFDWSTIRALLPAALALAMIGFMEAISIGKVLEDKTDAYKIRPNQELVALGISNVVGSFFSSYVVTGGFSRSAVNEDAGAKTGLALLISAAIILITLLFLTDLFQLLPKVVLAAIIFTAVIRLVDIQVPKNLLKTDKKEFLMYLATLCTTLFVGITEGIIAGLAISLCFLIYKVTVPHMAVMGRIPNSDIYKNKKRFPNVEIDDTILIVRFDARLFYANVNYFRDQLIAFEEKKKNLKTIIIDSSGINSIDSSAIQEIRKMNVSYKKRGVTLLFAGLKGPVRDVFKQNRVYSQHGAAYFFLTVDDALSYARGERVDRHDEITLQSNWSDEA